jgi:hypothetical protein
LQIGQRSEVNRKVSEDSSFWHCDNGNILQLRQFHGFEKACPTIEVNGDKNLKVWQSDAVQVHLNEENVKGDHAHLQEGTFTQNGPCGIVWNSTAEIGIV